MDFIVGLPRTRDDYDSIWVIVDRLTKVAHFIPVKTTYTGAKLAELYMSRIVCLHGVPKMIVSDRGTQFTSRFWEKLHESMDTKLNFSVTPDFTRKTECISRVRRDQLHTHDRQNECNTIAVINRSRVKPVRYPLLHPKRWTRRSEHNDN
jgi:hypothetical protein